MPPTRDTHSPVRSRTGSRSLNRTLIPTLIGLVCAVLGLLLSMQQPALSWENGPDGGRGFGTHDWVVIEAYRLAKATGTHWMTTDAAVQATVEPDTSMHDFNYHIYDEWGPFPFLQAPRRAQQLFDTAKQLRKDGYDFDASWYVGYISHYYSDICNPYHTDQSADANPFHLAYEADVESRTDAIGENRSWIVPDGLVRVTDVSSAVVAAGRFAHTKYGALTTAYTTGGFSPTVQTITAQVLSRAANDIADIIFTLEDPDAPPPPTTKPDLTVSSLVGPDSGMVGSTIIVSNTVANLGGAAGTSVVKFYLSTDASVGPSDILLGSRSISGISALSSSSADTSLVIPSSTPWGTYNLLAFADADGALNEANEGNNTRAQYPFTAFTSGHDVGAIIDSIAPNPADEGELVSFSGHGADSLGHGIVAYSWRSSLDGALSTDAAFQTSSLSVGTHTIYLRVQCSDGAWSPEVSGSVGGEAGSTRRVVIGSGGGGSGQETVLTIGPKSKWIQYPRRIGIYGRLRANAVGLWNHSIKIQTRRTWETTWRTRRTVTTITKGRYRFVARPDQNTYYRARFYGDTYHGAAGSPTILVRVRPRIRLWSSGNNTALHRPALITGVAEPFHPGQYLKVGRQFGRRWSSTWSFPLDRKSRTAFRWYGGNARAYVFRGTLPAHAAHLVGSSRAVVVTTAGRRFKLWQERAWLRPREPAAPASGPVEITIGALPQRITQDTSTSLSGYLSDGSGPLAGQVVHLMGRAFPTPPRKFVWRSERSAITGVDGYWSLDVKPNENSLYRAYYDAGGGAARVWSRQALVLVSSSVSLSVFPSSVWVGQTADVSATVRPAHQGKWLRIDRKRGKNWEVIVGLKLDSKGQTRFRWHPRIPGTYYMRAVLPEHLQHLSGSSAVRTLVVTR